MGSTAKRLLRLLVVATAVPPFAWVYRAIYRLVRWLTVRGYRRWPGLRAIYLTRGVAGGDFVPGVSDIDFAVFLEAATAAEQERLRDRHRRWAKRVWLVDPELLLFDQPSLRVAYARNPYFQFRLNEGRRGWWLLHGHDLLGELEPLDRARQVDLSRLCLRVCTRIADLDAAVIRLAGHPFGALPLLRLSPNLVIGGSQPRIARGTGRNDWTAHLPGRDEVHRWKCNGQ